MNDNNNFSTMLSFVIIAFTILCAVFFVFWAYIRSVATLAGKAMFAYLNNKMLKIDNIVFGPKKEEMFSHLHGMASELDHPLKLVELGAGTGSNFKYLPKNTEIVCVEPNEFSKKYLLANAIDAMGTEVKQFHIGFGEDMAFIETESVDVVVCTHVLCSVRDVDLCLKEILRVLKKGGKFLFMEQIEASHEASHGSRSHSWQHVFKHLWHFIAGGCHHTHSPHMNVKKIGFSKLDLDFFDVGPLEQLNIFFRLLLRLMGGPQCVGVATK